MRVFALRQIDDQRAFRELVRAISLALVACFGCSGDESPPPELGGGAASPGGNGNVAGAGSGGAGGMPAAGQGGSQAKGGSGAGLAGSGAAAGTGTGTGTAGRAAGGMNGAGMGPVSDAPPDLYAYYCSGCHGVQGAGKETLSELDRSVELERSEQARGDPVSKPGAELGVRCRKLARRELSLQVRERRTEPEGRCRMRSQSR